MTAVHTLLIRIDELRPDSPGYPVTVFVDPFDSWPAPGEMHRQGWIPRLHPPGKAGNGLQAGSDLQAWSATQLTEARSLLDGPYDARTAAAAGGLAQRMLDESEIWQVWSDYAERSSGAGRPLLTLFDVRDATLRELPWELLVAPELGHQHIAHHHLHRLARARWQPRPLSALSLPLRVLLVVGEDDDQRLRMDAEVEAVRTALRGPVGDWHLEVLTTPTRQEFFQAYDQLRPQVLHFAGHCVNDGFGRAVLRLRPPGAEPWHLTGPEIAGRFAEHPPQLVVLNACRGKTISLDPAVSVAGQERSGVLRSAADGFLDAGVTALVTMLGDLESPSAGLFAETLYTELAAERPLDDAVWRARRKLSDKYGLDRPDWALPSLTVTTAPTRVLSRRDLTPRHAAEKRFEDPGAPMRLTVDRVTERRQLLDGFGPYGPARPVVVVTGPEKIGKTTLVRHALHIWHRNGAGTVRVDLRSRGRSIAWRDALGMIGDALRGAYPAEADAALQQFDRRWRNEAPGVIRPADHLSQLLPAGLGESVGLGEDRTAGLFRSFGQALDTLAGQGAGHGLVLALDDLSMIEEGAVHDLFAPYLLNPLLARPDTRVRFVLIAGSATDNPGQILPWDVATEVAHVRVGPFSAADARDIFAEYGTALGFTAEVEARWRQLVHAWAGGGQSGFGPISLIQAREFFRGRPQ